MASQYGKWLSADHTFKISANIGYWQNKRWVKLYNSVFIVMNEENKVLAWQLARGTSIDTVESLLTGLKERHQIAQKELEGIIIDNCCSVKKKINAIFGSNVPIKLDLFHALKRILDQIPRKGVTADLRGVRQAMIKNLRLCFRDDNDFGHSRKRSTPPPDKMEKNLQDFLRKWSTELVNDLRVLPDKAVAEINKVMKHVRLGCLSGIPPGVGTNRNENITPLVQTQEPIEKLARNFDPPNGQKGIYKLKTASFALTLTELSVATDEIHRESKLQSCLRNNTKHLSEEIAEAS